MGILCAKVLENGIVYYRLPPPPFQFCVVLLSYETESFCSPSCPRIQYVTQDCLEILVVPLPQSPRITVVDDRYKPLPNL